MTNFLIIDPETLQTFVVSVEGVDSDDYLAWLVISAAKIPAGMNCPLLSRIFKRKVDFEINRFDFISFTAYCYGWELFPNELENLSRAAELFNTVVEFNQLVK